MRKRKYTFIDLFAGCGGLSEGFLESGGFEGLAHVEWELPMVETLRNRLVQKWNHSEADAKKRVVRFDIQKTEELIRGAWADETKSIYEKDNDSLLVEQGLNGIVNESVDLVIGGPPCQAYSIAGRAQDPNGMKDDYRNYLFESYAKVVLYYKPKLFVFENVPGLLSACPGGKPVKNRIFEAFKEIGYDIRTPENLNKSVYCASDYNTPQDRKRVIIIGVRHDAELNMEEFYNSLTNSKMTGKHLTVRDAIGNYPKFKPLSNPLKNGRANVSHVPIGENKLMQHVCRYNNIREVNVFREWVENDMNHLSTKEKQEYYTKITGKESVHVKYRSLEWDKPSPTIVAHLYKDGYMFIHPDARQARSITIREAASLQTFPDDFEFVGSNAYAYKMIGNAVPVQFAKAIAESIYRVLEKK